MSVINMELSEINMKSLPINMKIYKIIAHIVGDNII